MSTIKVNSIEPANAGSEDYFLARAWVNFNGTGTVAIRDSGNVTSITDNGAGDFTVNLSTASSDANYSVSAAAFRSSLGYRGLIAGPTSQTSSSARFNYNNDGGGAEDSTLASAIILR